MQNEKIFCLRVDRGFYSILVVRLWNGLKCAECRGCGGCSPQTDENEDALNNKLNVQINGQTFTASLENNEAVAAFVEILENAPVTIEMSDYSGFEKVGALGADLPASNSQITTQSGDIVLYQGNQIVIFYGSNSWSYTMIGRIDDLTGWKKFWAMGM